MADPKTYAVSRHDDPARFLPWLRDRNAAFAQLSPAAAKTLFRLSTLRQDPRASVLTRQDERPSHVFIVIEGNVVMRVNRNKLVRELVSYGPGEIAGVMALLDQHEAPYELVTLGPSQLIAIDAFKLAELAAAYHPAVTSLLQAMAPLLVAHMRDLELRAAKLAQRLNASLSGSGETFRRDDR